MSPIPSPILISIPEAARYLGVCRTTIYELIECDPTFPPIIKVMNASRIEYSALCEWVQSRGTAAMQSRLHKAQIRASARQTA